ncbi:hypothetical protein FN846DRAFT_893752 [Sphaerosporella brunnea]|uniref:Uncharacterized protein n=1 Tax=Sphaerosporella brunnea TaxID=1250544 RepID=A0A5J5ELH7_9PEZI|nr:hypothetical protein FN846DRAFT_893752 [Sphaerosporella brunnea]
MFVMEVNPKDNSLQEIEVEPYDRFPTEEEARMFTEEGDSFLSLRDSDLRRFGSCPETPVANDKMTENESWPLQLQYPTVNDGGSTSLTTKNTTFTPPPDICTFWEILAEFAEVEEWSPSLKGPPEGYKLQWKRIGGSAKSSDPWIELVDNRDAKQCAADVQEFLRTKRKTTNWKLVVQVVAPAKVGSEKRSHEDESSAESSGHGKRRKPQIKKKAKKTTGRRATSTERESTPEREVADHAVLIAEAHRCEKHPSNRHGCFINPNGEHVTMKPAMLKDKTPGVTVDHPPTHHFFDASNLRTQTAPKTRSRQAQSPVSSTLATGPFQPFGMMPNSMPLLFPFPAAASHFFSPTGGVPTVTTSPDRTELFNLPLSSFMARVQDMDTAHDYQQVEERFIEEGITPQLIPAMSDVDLDTVLGPGNMGMRLFLRRLVGRQEI